MEFWSWLIGLKGNKMVSQKNKCEKPKQLNCALFHSIHSLYNNVNNVLILRCTSESFQLTLINADDAIQQQLRFDG